MGIRFLLDFTDCHAPVGLAMTWWLEREMIVKKKSVVSVFWAVWYLICLFLSLGAEPVGMAKIPFLVVGVAAYTPPFYLLYLSKKDAKTIQIVQSISIASLVAFAVLFVLGVLSVNWSTEAGRILDILFKILCAPIVCGQFWVVGLFLWASLWRACALMLKKLNRPDQK